MENACFSFSLLILLLFPLCYGATIFSSGTDKQALDALKTSIISDPDAILTTNWSDGTSICSWIGVSCGVKHRRVTALNLSGYDLAGTVSPHLGNLTFLRYLDVSSNYFTGFLPSQLSNLRRLKVMNVGRNSFTGEVPTWLGNLPQLQQLILNNNSFSGRIPLSLFNNDKLQSLQMSYNLLVGNIPEEIGNASSLQILKLSHNQLSTMREIRMGNNSLSGSLPSDMCNNMPNFKILSLSGNQLSGEIPRTMQKCRNLEDLQLSINHFSGKIPVEIGSLSMLRELYLGVNDFQGGVPPELGNIPPNIWKCKQLEVLHLSDNKLSGSIPPEIGNMSMLTTLNMAYNDFTGELAQEFGTPRILMRFDVFNNYLSGSIPSSIFNISTLVGLYLGFNEFSGSLPPYMGLSLFNLEVLHLSWNRLNGPIPSSIINASKLTLLEMTTNSLSGSIPNFGSLSLLQELRLWDNNLSGAESPTQELTFLSSLTDCRYLELLDVSGNPLNGVLPTSIGNFSTSLIYLSATNSSIKGVIPSEIGNISSLLYLYLNENQVTGFIPPTMGKLERLQKMYLSDNQLVGSIPNHLCRLNNLGELGLSANMLLGPIPECLGDIKSLRQIYLTSNQFNSTIPPKFWTLIDLIVLDLSFNSFSGQLSSQVGNLKTLNFLDLSFNQLSGDIPTIIDGCQSLETLNLSNNMKGLTSLELSNNTLSGLVPKSLESLIFLRHFNVSYNKLEGEIPNEGCFLNFTALSFVHNSALCGSTRFQVSPCSKNHRGSGVKSFAQLMKYVVPPLILVVILVIIVLMLIRRHHKKKVPSPLTTNILEAVGWRRISYVDIERGTSSFSQANLLGKGSFGSIFEATLSDGLRVAVKVFNLQVERVAMSFDTECELLSTIRHRNILHIIGCCSSMEFKALILEYMPNGSLEKWLYSECNWLDLMQRVNIAIDVALALEYLHHGYTFPVVHCDIKPSNVLLDEDMMARVADFGIAKLFDKGEHLIHTETLATIGYAAPEYGSEGKLSTNGDVCSYGIMLLEMFTSRRPTDDIGEVVDPRLLAREDRDLSAKEQCVSSIFDLAMKCVASSPIERINMVEVVATLQKIKSKFVLSIPG